MAITTHAVHVAVGLAQLRIFEEEGADLSRVVIGHADSYPDAGPLPRDRPPRRQPRVRLPGDVVHARSNATARAGSWSSLCELLAARPRDRILLSQDVCHDSQLTRYEGHGYAYLAESFLPRLRAAGVSDAEIETMTVDNPRRLLTIG